ncbi:LacI family DNA-binding transcriptional regulator [Mollicutes bacterium LVI A0078]|nr:LacI family DNA-binding transcriptional regulator [Mollicutes bacterium LVI A0075]WOO90938.1 LacI family DNA-binding transcriptional regulator [Mollicutes bacterium LVI A0078]
MRKKRETKYVTIKDVAEKADVSIATVSRVLNNGRVRPERKRRVLDAMNELNYMPNNSARNLASVNATKRVSLVTPSLESFYIPFVEGFKFGLSIYKYEGVIETFNNDVSTFEDICSRQEANAEVRGIIQFAPKKELVNKNVISMLETNAGFNYDVSEELNSSKVGLYFTNDRYVHDFFDQVVFAEIDSKDVELDAVNEFDVIITNHIDTAFALINAGYKGIIRTVETATNVTVAYPNIQSLNFDLYGLGVFVSRAIIKEVNETEIENQVMNITIK